MKVLDLFSGIGGFSLGLERAGMTTVAFCEINPFCQRVLRKHWPDVPIYGDIRELSSQHLTADGIVPDLLCGGFPCQDISSAGEKVGLVGNDSRLWSEYHRLIGEIRPSYAIVENVADLLGRGLGDVLGDLAAIGFDAEWHCISAAFLGAPHVRDRVWVVAYPNSQSQYDGSGDAEISSLSPSMAYANGQSVVGSSIAWPECNPWFVEPDVDRVADGIPARVDRLRCLGNAVVPQIAEAIGRGIMRCANAQTT